METDKLLKEEKQSYDGSAAVENFILIPLEEFSCAITQETLNDPVVTPHGQTYSKSAIRSWLLGAQFPHLPAHNTDPVTRQPLSFDNVRDNLWLKNLLRNSTVKIDQTECVKITVDDIKAGILQQPCPNKLFNYLKEKAITKKIISKEELSRLEAEAAHGQIVHPIAADETALSVVAAPVRPARAAVAPEYHAIEAAQQQWRNYHVAQSRKNNFFSLLVLTGISIALWQIIKHALAKSSHDQTCQTIDTSLSYSFTVPWVPGGEITINNDQAAAVSISSLTFTSDAKLDGLPWGTLMLGGTLNTHSNANGYSYDYTVTPPNAVTIESGQSAYLQYNFFSNSTAGADFFSAIGMNPLSVSLQFADGSTSLIPLKGTENCAANPIPNYTAATWLSQWGMYQGFSAQQMPVQLYNQINYFNLGFNPATGDITSLDPYADNYNLPTLALFRQQYPYLKTLMSFGGFCSNPAFTELTSNSTHLENFATRLTEALKISQMDGVNFDWEDCGDGVLPDPTLYSSLFSKVRAVAKQQAQPFLITTAVPSGVDKISAFPEATWCSVAENVDQFHVMTYDDNGGWSKYASYLAPMQTPANDPNNRVNPLNTKYNVIDSIDTWRNMSCIDPKKLQVGIPTYGRAVNVATLGESAGWGELVTGVPLGQFDSGKVNSGIFNYRCIINNECVFANQGRALPSDLKLITTSQNPYGNFTALEPWGSSADQLMTISYDDSQAAAAKVKLVIQANHSLGGVHVWTVSQDAITNKCTSTTNDGNSISCSIFQTFKQADAQRATWSELFSPELIASSQQGLREGFIYTLLPILSNELSALAKQNLLRKLKQYNYSDERIDQINMGLRILTTLFIGAWFSTASNAGIRLLFSYLGFSNHATESAAEFSHQLFSSITATSSLAPVAAGMIVQMLKQRVAKSNLNETQKYYGELFFQGLSIVQIGNWSATVINLATHWLTSYLGAANKQAITFSAMMSTMSKLIDPNKGIINNSVVLASSYVGSQLAHFSMWSGKRIIPVIQHKAVNQDIHGVDERIARSQGFSSIA